MSKIVPLHAFGYPTPKIVANENPLNFKIKSYNSEKELLADIPSANTIGIITVNEITNWVFSPRQPQNNLQEGLIWFATDSNSILNFNALIENNITIYPIFAQQYIGGLWTDITVMSYIDNQWIKWISNLIIYDNGNEHTDVTGGIISYVTAGSVTKNSTNIYLSMDYGNPLGVTKHCVVYTANKIDLTHYKTLRIQYGCSDNDLTGKIVFISNSSPTSTVASSGISRATTETTLDISNFIGEYYIGAGMMSNQSYNAYARISIYKIILER